MMLPATATAPLLTRVKVAGVTLVQSRVSLNMPCTVVETATLAAALRGVTELTNGAVTSPPPPPPPPQALKNAETNRIEKSAL